MTSAQTFTEQIDLLELQVRVARLMVIEAQQISYFRPCRLRKVGGCLVCKIKRYILRGRFN